MTETYHNFKAVCKRHLDYICLNSSCHGANWAMKIESTKLKVFLQIFAILLQFCILGAFIQLVFLRPIEMQVKQEFPINDGSFPNVTICSHRMFDKKRIAGLFFISFQLYWIISNIKDNLFQKMKLTQQFWQFLHFPHFSRELERFTLQLLLIWTVCSMNYLRCQTRQNSIQMTCCINLLLGNKQRVMPKICPWAKYQIRH